MITNPADIRMRLDACLLALTSIGPETDRSIVLMRVKNVILQLDVVNRLIREQSAATAKGESYVDPNQTLG